MSVKSYRDLRVWQAGMDLAVRIYKLTGEFPREELYGITSQMRRAAVAIPSNIAEGHTREHTREYSQFVAVVQGSLSELATQLEIAIRIGYCSEEKTQELRSVITGLGRQLYSLRDALKRQGSSPTPDPCPQGKPPPCSFPHASF